MIRYAKREIEEAAREGQGFCLDCGEMQDFPAFSKHTPLCVECDEYRVVSAEDVLAVLRLVKGEEDE